MIQLLCLLFLLVTPSTLGYPTSDKDIIDPFTSREINHEPKQQANRSISNYQNINIDETVKEVEKIINENPRLPRLTRGEILDIIEDITKSDAQNLQKNFLRDPKSMMVVLPYTPGSNNQNDMEALYTKAPITQMIDNEGDPAKVVPVTEKRRLQFSARVPSNTNPKKPTQEIKKSHNESAEDMVIGKVEQVTRRGTKIRRRPEVTSTTTTEEPLTSPPKTRKPYRRTTTTTEASTTKFANHRYSSEERNPMYQQLLQEKVPSYGFNIVSPPQLLPTQINDDLSGELYSAEETKHDEVVYQSSTTEVPPFKPIKPKKRRRTTTTTTPEPIEEELEIPDKFKDMIRHIQLEGTVPASAPLPNEKPSKTDRQNMDSLLASLGIKDTTTTPKPDIESVAQNLSPEMKDLLMNFGLIPNPLAPQEPAEHDERFYGEKAEISPESYAGFKPLPEEPTHRTEMDELLASFGLGRSARKEKSAKPQPEASNKSYKMNIDMIPDNLKDVLVDVGLVRREGKKIDFTPKNGVGSSDAKNTFNPSDMEYATLDQIEQLRKLTEMVKGLEKLNRTITDDDLKHVDIESLKQLLQSLDKDQLATLQGQENLDIDPLFNAEESVLRNEVKRQETTTESATTEAPLVETSTTVVVEETNIKDLEASFGGTTSTEAPVELTTEAKKTGFYYLVDWNTFFDIDNEMGKRVSLRFQPKVGNPKDFFHVTTP